MTPSVGTDEARLDEVTPTRGPRSSISPGAWISATAVLLAALIVALILTPAGLWRHPANSKWTRVGAGFERIVVMTVAKASRDRRR
jgi:hypothetical protein